MSQGFTTPLPIPVPVSQGGTGVTTSTGTGSVVLSDNPTIIGLDASQAEMEAATSTSVYSSPGRQQHHPGHPKFFCRGEYSSGTPVAVSFYNQTSITDVAVGRMRHNFTINMSSTSFCPLVAALTGAMLQYSNFTQSPLVGSIESDTYNDSAGFADLPRTVMVLGDQ